MSLPRTIPALPDGATMALWPLSALAKGMEVGEPLYVSSGKWLHPLFDLLDAQPSDPAIASAGDLFLRDRVIGRAAAFLILRAGIRHAWADVVSDGALSLFAAQGAFLGGTERVAAIGCMTEDLLRDVDDPDLAWALLLARRQTALAALQAESPGVRVPSKLD
jgi:hypothetical protein